MPRLLKLIRLNGLEYNPNRDPQAYRRVAGEPFRIEALIGAGGTAHCALRDAGGAILHAAETPSGAAFVHDVTFSTPGVRLVTLRVTRADEVDERDLRLDVLDHAWIG